MAGERRRVVSPAKVGAQMRVVTPAKVGAQQPAERWSGEGQPAPARPEEQLALGEAEPQSVVVQARVDQPPGAEKQANVPDSRLDLQLELLGRGVVR